MKINVLYFAQARERAGRASAPLELPQGSRVADAVNAIRRAVPALDPLWPHLAIAVDGVLASPEAALREGAEVAVLPPVGGGGGRMGRATIEFHPATPGRWRDVEKLFGPRGACAGCWCMWPRLTRAEFRAGVGAKN